MQRSGVPEQYHSEVAECMLAKGDKRANIVCNKNIIFAPSLNQEQEL